MPKITTIRNTSGSLVVIRDHNGNQMSSGSSGSVSPPTKQPLRLMSLSDTVDAVPISKPVLVSPLSSNNLISNPEIIYPTDPRVRILGTTKVTEGFVQVYSCEFRTTADRVSFQLKVGTKHQEKAVRVYVDGRPISADMFYPTEDCQYLVELGSQAGQKLVRIDLSKVTMDSIFIPNGSAVEPTVRRLTGYMLGDSWVNGASYTATGNGPNIEHMAFLTGRLLDCAMVVGGIGGTGYGNGSQRIPPTNYSASDRLARIIEASPDFLVVFGSINDSNGDGSGIGKYATELFNFVRIGIPDCKIVVVGVQDWGGTNKTPILDSSPEITRAVKNAPNVVGYVQPAVEDWVTDQNVDLVNNKQYNDAHLTVYGNRYYAEKIAAVVKSSLTTM